MFEKLKEAYVKARYSKHYRISEEELTWLGEQVEVGLKYQPVGMNSFVTVALFDLKRQNVLTTDPNNSLFQVQTGEVRSRGVEFAVNANLMEGLNLVGAYTVYDLETTKDLNPANIGLMPAGVPESYGSLWLDYTVQNGTFKGFGVGAGVRFVGESYAVETEARQVAADQNLLKPAADLEAGPVTPLVGVADLHPHRVELGERPRPRLVAHPAAGLE